MITITKGGMTLRVTHGAYDNYYRPLGYKPVEGVQSGEMGEGDIYSPLTPENPACDDSTLRGFSDNGETPSENPAEDPKAKTAEEVFEYEEDLSEIPLGEMKLSQLIAYAEQLGLEHDGTPNKKEMRKLIREYLENQ